MVVAITGHRPDKLLGEYDGGPLSDTIYDMLMELIKKHNITSGITGMALGVDQIWAQACIEAGIPFTAAIPCKGQEKVWRPKSQRMYHTLLEQADSIIYTSDKYHSGCMQIRNRWMVDNCDSLICVWDGTSGGTKNCRDYAISVGIGIIPIDLHSLKNMLR